jgi:predicted phage gp36 major capsid-like protein
MELKGDSRDRPVEASLKATYRALLARGLETGEAANLTAFLHGLPSVGFHWTLPEIEAIVRRRLAHAADLRAAAGSPRAGNGSRHARTNSPARRPSRSGSTHVIDPPKL